MVAPKNNSQVKQNNIKNLLMTVIKKGPISKRELQDVSNLSWSTVSTLSSQLIEKKLIILSGKRDTDAGRKPDELDINHNDNFFVGIDLNSSGVFGVVIDLKGNIVEVWRKPVEKNDKDIILQIVFSILEEIIEKTYAQKNILGIGFAVQGIVDADNGISVSIPQFINWKNVKLKEMVEKRFGLTTTLMHDPNCIMIAEKTLNDSALKNSPNTVLLRLDNGIGMSIMVNGSLYLGSTGMAGEFGHISVCDDGPLCVCGNRGCLEEYASRLGLVKRFFERTGQGEKTSVDFSNNSKINCDTLAKAAKEKDKLCVELFIQMGKYLGASLSSIFNTYNPDVVILTGNLMEHKALFYDTMVNEIISHVYPNIPVNIKISDLGYHAAAQGAAMVACEKIINAIDFLNSDF